VLSICLGGKTGRTARGGLFFCESMDRLGKVELGPGPLLGLVGPCDVFLMHLFGWCALGLHVHDLIPLLVYDHACHVPFA